MFTTPRSGGNGVIYTFDQEGECITHNDPLGGVQTRTLVGNLLIQRLQTLFANGSLPTFWITNSGCDLVNPTYGDMEEIVEVRVCVQNGIGT